MIVVTIVGVDWASLRSSKLHILVGSFRVCDGQCGLCRLCLQAHWWIRFSLQGCCLLGCCRWCLRERGIDFATWATCRLWSPPRGVRIEFWLVARTLFMYISLSSNVCPTLNSHSRLPRSIECSSPRWMWKVCHTPLYHKSRRCEAINDSCNLRGVLIWVKVWPVIHTFIVSFRWGPLWLISHWMKFGLYMRGLWRKILGVCFDVGS